MVRKHESAGGMIGVNEFLAQNTKTELIEERLDYFLGLSSVFSMLVNLARGP